MGQATYNPTANQTPDATLGGSAVTTPTNLGYANTSLTAVDGENFSASWRGFSFPAIGGPPQSVTLKVDWSHFGSLTGAGSKNNSHKIEYSVNGGGAWTTLLNNVGITSSSNGTATATLTLPLDATQLQVRSSLSVTTSVAGTTASVTANISQVRIEVVVYDVATVMIL